MRAYEFIKESTGVLSKDHADAMPGVHRTRDNGGYDRIYHMNRMGMALSMADGKNTNAVAMDEASWAEKYNTIHPYTQEEENMVQQALKTIPSEHMHTVKDRASKESEHVHRKSPVSGFRGYPR